MSDPGISAGGEQQAAPAGWYPDPERPGQQRYWDGVKWAPPVVASVEAGPDADAPTCPDCGLDQDATWNYCRGCGRAVERGAPAEQADARAALPSEVTGAGPSTSAPPSEVLTPPVPASLQTVSPAAGASSPRLSRTAGSVVIAVVTVLVLVVVGLLFMRYRPRPAADAEDLARAAQAIEAMGNAGAQVYLVDDGGRAGVEVDLPNLPFTPFGSEGDRDVVFDDVVPTVWRMVPGDFQLICVRAPSLVYGCYDVADLADNGYGPRAQ